MDFKIYAVGILIHFYFLGTNAVELLDLYKPHILLKSKEMTVEAGSNVAILCDGNAPLSWQLPEELWYFSYKDHEYWKGTTIHITEVPPKGENYKYGSKIVLKNVTYPHTGFIICYESDRPFRQDKIYMYIRDEKHLCVSTETDVVIYVNTGEYVLVPIRITAPNVVVNINVEHVNCYHYDPYYGYVCIVQKKKTEFVFQCLTLEDRPYFANYNYSVRFEQPLNINLTKTSKKVTHLGEELRLFCEAKHKSEIKTEWITPIGDRYTSNELLIENVRKNNQGVYICRIREKFGRPYLLGTQSIYVNVVGNLINLTEETEAYEVDVNVNKNFVQWSINIDAFPEPELCWLNNLNQEISQNSNKYTIEYSRKKTILKILNISIFDSGYYTLTANNSYGTSSVVLFLNVVDKPLVYIDFFDDGKYKFQCWIFANPRPSRIFWEITPRKNDTFINEPTYMHKNGFQSVAYGTTNYANGLIKCSAKNSMGIAESVRSFYLKEVTEGIHAFGLDSVIDFTEETNEVVVALHEKLILSCDLTLMVPLATPYGHYPKTRWFHNGTEVQKELGINFARHLLVITYLTLNNSGIYSCENKNNSEKSENFKLRVSEPPLPNITDTNLAKEIKAILPLQMELICKPSGLLKRSIIWYKDNIPLEPSTRIKMLHQNQTINFTSTEVHDEGYYECIVSNKYGKVSKGAYVTFLNNPGLLSPRILAGIVISVMLIALSAVFIVSIIRYEYKLRQEIANFGLVNFETGDLIHINPNLSISEQVDSLPYHYKWEFPIQEVKFEEQIGSGAFGIVMKAEARRIVDGEDFTTVAVKMVKRNKGFTCIRALVSELKIMAYLENHLNIVNLLGADTKNLNKGELFVIVEYCRYGNVRNYLLNRREHFVNQVDLETDTINYSIGQNISLESNLDIGKGSSSFSKYDINKPGTSSELAGGSRNDNDGNAIAHSLCTEDLLVWAFQVARGMDFLASNHILHGDLAARNILLCDDNVVKICDFGLSRRVYTNRNYKKKSNSPLPLKWMAVESIRDGIFSVESDVWSFGVVLWEFFTLGQTPYPGIQDEQLFPKLEFGYRMERPKYAPQEIYQVMLECWRGKPFVRPSFWKLMDRISSLLEEEVKQRYFDLKRPKPRNITQRVENVAGLNRVDFEDSSSSSMLTSKNDIELVPL